MKASVILIWTPLVIMKVITLQFSTNLVVLVITISLDRKNNGTTLTL